jgi:hypothetical protein
MRAILFSLALFAPVVGLAGCSVQGNGQHDNADVKIQTPFGGMKVKTNEAVNTAEIGLASYPGATQIKEDKDNGSADVDMNFGNFHLRVKAAGYHTSDSPEKVKAFYLKDLGRYGDVLECRNNAPVGKRTKTAEGLTCSDDDEHAQVQATSGNKDFELKAGSKLHQHIVSVEKEANGTKFGLVALELPNTEKSESN